MKSKASRVLMILGLVAMVVGAIDPLEGSVVILAGTLLAAMGALLGAGPRNVQLTAFGLVAVGVAALFALSSVGGVGGRTGRSYWWLLVCAPYPVGWLMGLAGAVKAVRRPRAAA